MVDNMRSVVVFPAPLTPSNPKISPSRHSKLTSPTARISPRASSWKIFVRPATTTGAACLATLARTGTSGCHRRLPHEPLPHELHERPIVGAEDKVLMTEDGFRELQSGDDADDLHGDGHRNQRPVIRSPDGLPEHHCDVDYRNERRPHGEFLFGPLEEGYGQQEKRKERADQRLTFPEGPGE